MPISMQWAVCRPPGWPEPVRAATTEVQSRGTPLKTLQDGQYPFRENYYPLTAMVMTEAPPELEAFLAAHAAANGIEIVRDEPVELVCAAPDMDTNRFLVFWPSGSERMHLLVPRHLATGLA